MRQAGVNSIEIKDGHFRLGGEPFFIYSGEVHYFRIAQKDWKARLRQVKAAGFNTVSTYIPWIWHEPEEGKRDFADVLKFIDLAKSEGLWCLARVGPVSNAELKNEGIPTWLLKNYPDVSVIGHRDVGTLPHVTMLSYLHPVFQEKVGAWYDALLPEIAPRQVTRGGNVLGVQLCNEVAMVHWLQKGADRKEHVNRMYRSFLREKYGDVRKLNEAHQTGHASFDEVEQPKADNVELSRLAPFVDWALFYRRYYATYFLSLSSRARDHGIDVPLYCNIPQFYDYDVRGRGNWAPMTTSMFRDFPLLTPGLIFGGAYQMRHLDFENFHDVALTTEITRMLNTAISMTATGVAASAKSVKKSRSGAVAVAEGSGASYAVEGRLPALPEFEVTTEPNVPVVCAELQTGIMRDRPRLYPQQVLLNVKSSVGQGLAGVNAYMLAGGVNPPGMGAFGTYHDWQAPIGPDGKEKAHLAPLKDFGRFLKWAGPLLSETRKAADTTFGFYLPYYATEYLSGPWVEKLEGQRTNFWYDGLARLVQLAGFSYDYTDLQRASASALAKAPALWVYSLDFMDKETQTKLADYVRSGGKLALTPRLPTLDLLGRPEKTLAEALGVSPAGERTGNVFTRGGEEFWVQGPFQTFHNASGQEALAPLPGDCCAAFRKRAGRGEALVVGFGLPHVFDHYKDWVRGWAESFGLKRSVTCSPWDVQASLRRAKDHGFLFLFNYHFTERDASASFALPGTGEKVTLSLPMPPLSAAVLPLNVPLADGRRLAWCTAEPRDLRSGPKQDEAAFAAKPGQNIEVVISASARPRSAKADGKSVKAVWKNGRAKFSIRAAGELARLSLRW